MKKILLINLMALVLPFISLAQQKQAKDKGYFKELDKGFYEKNILRGIEDFEEPKTELPKRTAYKIDLSNRIVPKSVDEFTGYWKNNPISQGATGTCWSFSTTSFFETEVYRITKKQVKISEMYTAYWEYVEKTIRFIEQRGNSLFDEGSEANAVTRIFKQYGAVPLDAYTGMKNGQSYHNHKKMVDEMKWSLDEGVSNGFLNTFFKEHEELFKHSGGSLETFLSKCKMIHAKRVFNLDKEVKFIITQKDINDTAEYINKNKHQEEKKYLSYYT